MNTPSGRSATTVIDRNFARFEQLLPSILLRHEGQVALLHDGEIVRYFSTPTEAILHGRAAFGAGQFSVQRVEQQEVDLGCYSRV
jgi:hypothetical protein